MGEVWAPSGQTFKAFFMKEQYDLDHDGTGGSGKTQISFLTGVGSRRFSWEPTFSRGD